MRLASKLCFKLKDISPILQKPDFDKIAYSNEYLKTTFDTK